MDYKDYLLTGFGAGFIFLAGLLMGAGIMLDLNTSYVERGWAIIDGEKYFLTLDKDLDR